MTQPEVVLSPSQRRHLKALAHPLKPIVWVGEKGINESLIEAVNQALLQHELIKVRLLEPEDKAQDAARLSEETGAAQCGLVGHTVILYKPHPEQPKLHLPS